MTDFIEPLAMETWLGQVLAGTPDILLGVALMVIFGLAGYFRMNMFATFFMIIVFLLLFNSFMVSTLITLIAIIGGLLIGFLISKTFTSY